MANVLMVTEEFFVSPYLPAGCLFSGQTANVRVRSVGIDRDSLTRQCMVFTVVGAATLGFGLVWLFFGRRGFSANIPCERRAWMRWRLRRDLGLFCFIAGPLLGFAVAVLTGQAAVLSVYLSTPTNPCGCASFGMAWFMWLFGTPGGWITLGGVAAGLAGLIAAQISFYLQCVTLRHLGASGEVTIHFPDSHTDTFVIWRDAYIAYTQQWNETHRGSAQSW